jgi:hypothetical protein
MSEIDIERVIEIYWQTVNDSIEETIDVSYA